MKKTASVLLMILMVAMLCVTAFAATGLNANEQAVIDKLEANKTVSKNSWSFTVPEGYINAVKNYLISSYDMTAQQSTAVNAYIDSGIQIIKADADYQNFTGAEFKLSDMSQAARTQVIALGQQICAEMALTLSYSANTGKVTISDANGALVYDNTAVIKTTGEEFVLTAGKLAAAIAVVMAAASVAMLATAKKGLLVK